MTEGLHPETIAVRAGQVRTEFEETAEPIFLSSGYVYRSAEAAQAAFAGETDRFVYSRYGNPTVRMFEQRLAALDGAEGCFATASGMSAVFVALSALCAQGSRLVAARSLFGSCFVICNEILPRWGVEVEFVDGHDLQQWERALARPATAVFFETPSNPLLEIIDVRAVSDLAHAAGATVVVDNVLATPLLQRGFELGADVLVYSATKHIDGQGRALGGAILGSKEFIGGPVTELMRHTGPAMSPFNAWIMLKGLETMPLRVQRMSSSAQTIAEFLERHSSVGSVRYPLLASHPQFQLASEQMLGGGSVLAFEFAADTPGRAQERAFGALNRLQLIDISNNLGDAKSLITHPATTTHRAIGAERRAEIGLSDALVRLSVGLEHPDDLIADLNRALA